MKTRMWGSRVASPAFPVFPIGIRIRREGWPGRRGPERSGGGRRQVCCLSICYHRFL